MTFKRNKYYSLVQQCEVCGGLYAGLPRTKYTPKRDMRCNVCVKEGKTKEEKGSAGL